MTSSLISHQFYHTPNSLHVAPLGSQVKWSLILIISEVQMLYLQDVSQLLSQACDE